MSEASLANLGSATRTFPISLGGRVLSDPAEGLFFLSEPRPGGEKVKAAIDRAAKAAKLAYWRAFDIWYRKARRVEAYEIDAIIEAAEAKEARELRDEFQSIRTRIAILESRLVSQDPDFHRETIGALRQSAGLAGGKGRP